MLKCIRRWYWFILIYGVTHPAFAGGTGPSMPWDRPLKTLQDVLTGTTAQVMIIIAIAVSGIAFAMGDTGTVFKRAGGIVFGASIATGAASLFATLGFSGAVI